MNTSSWICGARPVLPDGVYAKDPSGKLVFHQLEPKQEDIEKIAARIVREAAKLLASLEDGLVPTLSIARALDRPRRSLLCGFPRRASSRSRGECLPTSTASRSRPRGTCTRTISLDRMSELPNWKILIRLKRPMANGVAAIELTPMALMRRLD